MIGLAALQGHWVRDWIKAPSFEDHTTRVHWMQAGADFADIRVPSERPALGDADCLEGLDAAALLALAQAEGFAGRVTLEDDRCTWHREVNWHGVPDTPDIGAISFDDDGRMIEAGVLAEYTELWEQRAEGEPHALRLSGGDYSGLLVIAGDVGVLGIGRTEKPASQPVLAALKDGAVPLEAATLFDGLHALCRVEAGAVVAVLATNPFVEGQPVLTLAGGAAVWHRTGFDGKRGDVHLKTTTLPK